MAAIYNEIDPFCIELLRRLMKAGEIEDGEVDTRSIVDVHEDDYRGFKQIHLFSGIGGWAYSARLAGWPSDRPLRTVSCPCQGWSAAGRQKGFEDERHLWPHAHRILRANGPAVIMGEQVERAVKLGWLDAVFNDLEGDDYACRSVVLPACSAGAHHNRPRIAFVAHPERYEQSRQESCGRPVGRMGGQQQPVSWNRTWQGALSEFRAMADGIPRNVGATDAARNAIVPPLFAEVMTAYLECYP